MNDIELAKKLSKLKKESQQRAKRDTCLLCGKQVTGFCKSHLIPQFVLNNIASNGTVVWSADFIDTFNKHQHFNWGVAKAETFYVICNLCDNTMFQDYENEIALSVAPTNRMMAEIAIKNLCRMLSNRFVENEEYPIMEREFANFRGKDAMLDLQNLDIKDFSFSLKRAKSIVERNLKSGFHLMYWLSLPFVAPIASQTMVIVYKDMDGVIINNIYTSNDNDRMQELHLCIFPLKSSTVVFLFYHKDDTKYRAFEKRFNRLSNDDKLKYTIYLLLHHSEEFVVSPLKTKELAELKGFKQLVSEGMDGPDLGFKEGIDLLLGTEEPLLDWRITPNILSEEYKLL